MIQTRLKRFYYEKQGYEYEPSKRMFYKVRSKCHGYVTEGRTVLNKRVLRVPFSTLKKEEQEAVKFLSYCMKCHKPCEEVWQFKHLRD